MAKTVLIKEGQAAEGEYSYILDLQEIQPKHCTGCWSCWLRTPGRCMHHDLDEFYRQYLAADKVIILSKVKMGFVSANLKTLFDRMIGLFLPYISYQSGESMHVVRYEKMPEVEIYYEGDFLSEEEEAVYQQYLQRTMYQFRTGCDVIAPLISFKQGGKEEGDKNESADY